jgi:O-antigen/teichoic acid export membrane protein
MIPFTILVLVFAKTIIYWLAGAQYLSATPLLQILLITVFPKIWGRVFGITLDAIGKPSLNFKILVGSIFSNLLFSLLFIPLWGVKGAAWAVLLSVIFNVSIGQFLLSKTIPIQQINILKQLWFIYKKLQLLNKPKSI